MKISIIGTGMIAGEVMAMLREENPQIEVSSIYVRSNRERAERLAVKYGVEHVYTDYAELLAHDEADFVYIALANAAHYGYGKMALEAGRNVILEKPITLSLGETEELVRISRSKGLYLFEAMSLLHVPNFRLVRESIAKLGNIRLVQCNFSQYSSRYDRYLRKDIVPAFDPQCGGGALMDLNIYNLHVVVGLFGVPVAARYYPNKGYNGVDTSGIAVLEYPRFVVSSAAAKDSSSPSFIMVQGEKGWLCIDGTPNELGKVELFVEGTMETYELNNRKSRLADEFSHFEAIFRQGDYAQMEAYLEHSLRVMGVIDRLKQVP